MELTVSQLSDEYCVSIRDTSEDIIVKSYLELTEEQKDELIEQYDCPVKRM